MVVIGLGVIFLILLWDVGCRWMPPSSGTARLHHRGAGTSGAL